MTRRFWGICLVSIALTASLGLVFAREQAGGAAGARAAAEKAWRAGQYQDVDRLAQGQNADEPLAILGARSAAAVGDYARAESILQPFATKTPGGDAALELGLLQSQLGRRTEARRSLQLMLLAAQDADTAREYLRAGRAARALGRFEDANGFFREASTLAPADIEVNTALG